MVHKTFRRFIGRLDQWSMERSAVPSDTGNRKLNKAATTMIYLHADKEELYQSIERANENDRLKRIKEIQEKI